MNIPDLASASDPTTYAADQIDFDPPGKPDDSCPPACHCDACLADLTAPADPWADEVEATPYSPIDGTPTAPYSPEDAAWVDGYDAGEAMLPVSVPGGLSVGETVAWCEGNAAGWKDALVDELARLDWIEAEEEAEAAMADRYARHWDAEAMEAGTAAGHGYGPDFEDPADPRVGGGL